MFECPESHPGPWGHEQGWCAASRFGSIIWCLLLVLATQLAAGSVLQSWQRRQEGGLDDVQEPLLTKTDKTPAGSDPPPLPRQRQACSQSQSGRYLCDLRSVTIAFCDF